MVLLGRHSLEVVGLLAGEDRTVRPQIAYATLLSRCLAAPSAHLWTHQLKCLLLLDRLNDESLFTRDTGGLTLLLPPPQPPRFHSLDTQRLMTSMWGLVRYGAQVSEGHVVGMKRSQRKAFLGSLDVEELLNQTDVLESLWKLGLDVVREIRGSEVDPKDALFATPLIKTLLLRILHKLMLLYACQLQCTRAVIPLLPNAEDGQLRALRRMCARFKSNSLSFVRFLQEFRFVGGFEEINFAELHPFQDVDLPKLMEKMQVQRQQCQDCQPALMTLSLSATLPMRVNHLPLSELGERTLKPRIHHPPPGQQPTLNPFHDWNSSFSDTFPQREIMTLGLIMDIRKEQEVQYDVSKTALPYIEANSLEDFDEFLLDLTGEAVAHPEKSVLPRENRERGPLPWVDEFSELPPLWNFP